MTGKIKKAIASVLAVASLSTCAVGISASAATVTDSYSGWSMLSFQETGERLLR